MHASLGIVCMHACKLGMNEPGIEMKEGRGKYISSSYMVSSLLSSIPGQIGLLYLIGSIID